MAVVTSGSAPEVHPHLVIAAITQKEFELAVRALAIALLSRFGRHESLKITIVISVWEHVTSRWRYAAYAVLPERVPA